MDKLSLHSLSSDNASSEFEVVNNPINSNVEDSNGMEVDIEILDNDDTTVTDITKSTSDNCTKVQIKSEQKHEPEVYIATDKRPDSLTLNETTKSVMDSDTDKTPTKASVATMSQTEEDCILFSKVFYLGSAPIDSPRSEIETIKFISAIKQQQIVDNFHRRKFLPSINVSATDCQQTEIEVVLSLPRKFNGTVRLLDPASSSVIASFELSKILFCVRGQDESPDNDCFSFNEATKPDTFECHVFRCEIPEAVRKVMCSFENAFRATEENLTNNKSSGFRFSKKTIESGFDKAKSLLTPVNDASPDPSRLSPHFDRSVYDFSVSLEIREDDGKGGFATVPWDKTSSCFKFRSNLQKQVNVTVLQTNNVQLTIERCFGLLLTPGRNVKQSDMHLLDMERDESNDDAGAGDSHSILGIWDPSLPHFTLLNTETQKGTRVFLSVAVDLVVQEIRDPVRFLIETKARIFPQNEKFWYFGRKILLENFYVRLKDIEDKDKANSRQIFDIESIESESSRLKERFQTCLHHHQEQSLSSSCPQDEEDDDDTDEPLLSGSGEVNRECSDRVLSDWGIVLNRWRADLSRRPTGIRALVRSGSGVPEALRGEVWQLLAGCYDNSEMLEKYRVLITQDSSQENIIQRDVHRTFPAHDFFQSVGGLGQDSLYRISKAYSVFDREVGYCQGLSFLAAALLLHMPEEQAFCVLVKVMYDYKMRNLFKNGFEDLHLKFYQLERLTEELLPSLHDHFKQLSIECHMFSSQWFLTLFTAKFPLNMVYHVVDIFLCEGELVVFKVALGLLECCRQELLALDFEGVLKYFRVQLPKKYRSDDQVKLLIQAAVNVKVSRKKLDRYEKDYGVAKERMALEVDPLIRIERENKQLMESNMRLELENDEIAQELVLTRVTLNTQLHKTMEHANILQRDLQGAINELRSTRSRVVELTDENNRLHDETKQVKEMCRREMARQEEDIVGKEKIITDYKTICSQMSKRIEKLQTSHKEEINAIKKSHTQPINGDATPTDSEQRSKEERERLTKHIRDLELELAQTKLKLVESECKVQDVEHQLISTSKELHASKNTWFQKTISTFTAKKPDSPFIAPPPTSALSSAQNKSAHVTTTVTSFGRHQITS